MYNGPAYPCPYCGNTLMHTAYHMYPYPYAANTPIYNLNLRSQSPNQYLPYVEQSTNNPIVLKDYGPNPLVINIEEATEQNRSFRTSLWTGSYLQLTLMSINVGEDIGLEVHPDLDQFIRIEEGQGLIRMGDTEDNLDFQVNVRDDFALIIPAGKWHNLFNTGNIPLKLYSIYAPPQHPFGTVHETKKDAEEDHTH